MTCFSRGVSDSKRFLEVYDLDAVRAISGDAAEALKEGCFDDACRQVVIDAGYADMDFPFARVEVPELVITRDLDLDGMCGYLDTWSGYRRCVAATGDDPLPALRAQLAPLWGTAHRQVTWPLPLHAGRP